MFTHWFDFYHFDEIKNRSDYQFIAIIGKQHVDKFPEKIKPHFDKIAVCDNNTSEDKILETLELSQVDKVVNEVVNKFGKDEVYLISVDDGSVQPAAKLRKKYQLPGLNEDIAHPVL